jgi:hypothetical protein
MHYTTNYSTTDISQKFITFWFDCKWYLTRDLINLYLHKKSLSKLLSVQNLFLRLLKRRCAFLTILFALLIFLCGTFNFHKRNSFITVCVKFKIMMFKMLSIYIKSSVSSYNKIQYFESVKARKHQISHIKWTKLLRFFICIYILPF